MNLKAERLNRGLSRDDLAAEVGMSRETVRQMEEFGIRPRAAAAKRVADFYGCLVTDIWPVDDSNGQDEPMAVAS